MNKFKFISIFFFAMLLLAPMVHGAANLQRNPPECDRNSEDCGCDNGAEVAAACIKVNLDLGETTPWTGSMQCALKIFADSDSPNVFSQLSLYAVLGGYTFKRLGPKNLSDGLTPAEVVLAHPNGEPVHFVFKDGESIARPDPGVHIKMDERLMMVDAQGWATTSEPVYYDLYIGDGSKRRFMATNMTGALGELVSITTPRGVTMTPDDMGVHIVYDSNGVRQFLTPSRLADVTPFPEFKGYEVKVYPIQDKPLKDSATGLYIPPQTTPVKHLKIVPENGWQRAIVTLKSGDNDPKRYVFNYAFNDWSLTHASGREERKERDVLDSVAAYIKNETVAADGKVLSRKVKNYKYESWGYAMTNRVEGFGGVTDTTSWTYYTSGNGKGQVKTEKRQSGLLIEYAYDSADRVISEKRSGPDMMTEMTTYDYTPVDPSDPVLPVDTRPRTIVKTLNGIECERTYYVYAPLTNIIERVGMQGAAYGGTNVLRTVTAFYPVTGGPLFSAAADGRVASVRHEDGKLDVYDYALNDGIWMEMVTHLHEQSPAPVSGKTTRDITLTNARGEVIETRTEVFIDNVWYTIVRERLTYNTEGKRIKSENLAGQVTTTAWDCCHKISEVQPDGSTTMWEYDEEGRMIASSRLIPLDMTNVTWLTTCYEYDDLGRQIATWQTNRSAKVGLPVERTMYDPLGRVTNRIDRLGNNTATSYSNGGRTMSVLNPNTSTRIITRSVAGYTLSITGTAVTPEFHTYGIQPDGTRWAKTVEGETASSPRFTKRFENLLCQTIREERSGFRGAVLATTHIYDSLGRLVSTSADYEPTVEYTYDVLGNRVATTKTVGGDDPGAPQSETTEWRKSESLSHIAIIDGDVWLTQTNIVSCSDSAITPLVTSSARQLTGLTFALPARSRSFDVRGNVTENETLVDSSFVTSRQTVPYATNKPLSISRYGVSLMDVSVSAVTNTVAYDSLGRQIANTDGRGNTRHTEYNSFGQRAASIDALGNRTSYSCDQFGNLVSVIDPLGNAIIYEYDLRGRKTYEGGATYPARYTYDIFGNKTTMTTFRDAGGPTSVSAVGDTTTWLYDIASGAMTNKVYADGKGPSYTYTPEGKLSQRTWARGIVTDYSYDNWGSLTNRQYSDSTPHVSCAYDAMGRQVEMCSLSARTLISYDAFGRPVSEIITHDSTTNTILRHYDEYGRRVGHSLDGIRCVSLSFDPLTSRLDCMSTLGDTNYFHWLYKPCSNLKSALEYPNGLVCNLEYEPKRDLLVLARSVFNTNLISRCIYHYDAVGHRDQINIAFGSVNESAPLLISRNEKREITAITDALSGARKSEYFYDDIGNRLSSNEHDHEFRYSSNSLCQPTQVINSNGVEIAQEYDLDGNQTLALTSTGLWSIQYDAENRPWQWTSGNTNIVMTFDGDGRRIKADVTVGGAMTSSNSFAYDGYDMIGEKSTRSTDGEVCEWRQTYVWLPFETVRSVPLVLCRGTNVYYYVSDGVKNVSAIVDSSGYTIASYDSHPLGGVRTITDETDGVLSNPFVFSSEYRDELLGVIHYAYRSYNSLQGRWLSRDLVDIPAVNPYALCSNTGRVDYRGAYDEIVHYYFLTWYLSHFELSTEDKKLIAIGSIYVDYGKWAATKILDKKTVYNFERERNSKLLHNLGSLDKNGIKCYRDCLKGLFDRTDEPLDSFQKGVLLHIIADTFAHQTISEESYGSFSGHLWVGTAPDDIRRSKVGEDRFRDFVNTLNDLFKADTATKKIVDGLLSDIYKGEMVWRERPWQIWVINPIVALFMPSGEWQFQYVIDDYRTEIMKKSKAEWTSEVKIEENILKENRDASVEELLKSITDCFLKSGGKLR